MKAENLSVEEINKILDKDFWMRMLERFLLIFGVGLFVGVGVGLLFGEMSVGLLVGMLSGLVAGDVRTVGQYNLFKAAMENLDNMILAVYRDWETKLIWKRQ